MFLLLESLVLHFSQTLTKLNLHTNHIGHLGAQYLANALERHEVILIFIIELSVRLLFAYISQTLTELNLLTNEIGASGTQHLANSLKRNKVILISRLCL